MTVCRQNIVQVELTKTLACISTCVKQIPSMPDRRQNVIHVLTKTLLCLRVDKMFLYMCRPNSFHASEDKKCISSCVEQTLPIQARTQNASQHLLTIALPCQKGHNMHLQMLWLNTSHASEDLTCLFPASTQNVHQHVFTKPISCQRGQK